MGLTLIVDTKAQNRIYPLCLKHPDPRARWLAKKQPEATRAIIRAALANLPTELPHFPTSSDRQAFVEQIQFDTILTLRSQELSVGIALQAASSTRWQWVAERAIGELAAVVVERFLAPE